jgi:hypothetical protein
MDGVPSDGPTLLAAIDALNGELKNDVERLVLMRHGRGLRGANLGSESPRQPGLP